jgi:HEAT repeat protein
MFLQKLKLIGIAGLAVGLAGGVWGAAGTSGPGAGPVAVAQSSQPNAVRLDAPAVAPMPRAVVQDPVRAAFEKLVAADGNWQQERPALDELKALGEKAKDLLVREAERHPKERVRNYCYELITEQFPKDDRVIEQAVRGLSDPAESVRYRLAFWLGEQKVFAAHRRLRIVMDDPKNDDRTRLTAAKSLAQLGEPDVIRKLYTGLESDWYMDRYIAHLGVKGLAGKSPDDFGGYRYSEGAFVSGGREYVTAFDAITRADKKVKRYQAILAFCTWLKEERPDLYKHLTGTF